MYTLQRGWTVFVIGEFELTNTNSLINTYEGCNGLKTGFTEESMYNLSATATRNNLSLIAVVVGGPTSSIRNEEIKQLFNYGFTNYAIQTLAKETDMLENITINKHVTCKITPKYEADSNIVHEKGQNINFTQDISYIGGLTAPIAKGTIIAKATFRNESQEILTETNIIVAEDISRSTFLEYLAYVFDTFGMHRMRI